MRPDFNTFSFCSSTSYTFIFIFYFAIFHPIYSSLSNNNVQFVYESHSAW